MTRLEKKKISRTTTVHGAGGFGGKGEGLIYVDDLELEGVQPLRSEIFTREFFDRYRAGGGEFDDESRTHLREVLSTFPEGPISVRASGELENDPQVATSGESVSYMLPNRHRDPEQRFAQLLRAIGYIYQHFAEVAAEQPEREDGGAFLINPIPGVTIETRAGTLFAPMSSGVADSFCKHPLKLSGGMQDPKEGFARVAFGHGYAVVREDFDVIPLATIKNPIDPRLTLKGGQRFFYGIDLEGDAFGADEMSTMTMLNIRLADPATRAIFEDEGGNVTFEPLVLRDRHGYQRGLESLLEQLSKHGSHFQIEFTWNLVDGAGVFHVVQFKRLREAVFASFELPPLDERSLVRTENFGGHGVIEGIRHAIVINPFVYEDKHHDEVLARLKAANDELGRQGERYVFVCPGRIGTTNRKWGFNIDYRRIRHAAALVEYGYDVTGSSTIEVEVDDMTGGLYGSHFLYQILGGASEAEKRRQARMFGSQGTHFLTNLYTSGTVYMFVNPAKDHLAKWFFSPPEGSDAAPLYIKRFPSPVTIYANLLDRQCMARAAEPL